MGADFQCVAAKYMGAPHSTGFALGTKEIISRIAKIHLLVTKLIELEGLETSQN